MKNPIPRMVFIAVLLLLLFAQPGCRQAEKEQPVGYESAGGYIPVEDYFQQHPEQKELNRRFDILVQGSPKPVPSSIQEKEVTVAVVYPGEQASDYWRRSLSSFSARMDALGISYTIDEYFSKAGGQEIRKQEEQLKNALARDPDYLVFTLDVHRHLKVIGRILSQDRPFLILQNITTPLSRWEGYQPFYVGFDHQKGTRMLADHLLAALPDAKSYGLLYYSQGYVSEMRGDTFMEMMQTRNGPQLAGSFYTDGKRDLARQAALELLQHEDLAFIYNCSTDVALGAMDAARETGNTGKVLLNGWGGGSAELEALQQGHLDVTVMRMNDDNGVAMAEAIRLRLLDRGKEVPTVFSGKFELITRHTPATEINRMQQRAFRYSGYSNQHK